MLINETYNQAAATDNSARRAPWDLHELDALTKEFIEQRKADPFAGSLDVLRSSMKVLPEHRRKDVPTWQPLGELRRKLADAWLEEMTKQTPAPVIVHVETQAPPDYIDILNRCDLPSLTAMLVAKVSENLAAFKPVLTALNGGSNGNGAHVGAPHQAPVSLLSAASAKPRKTRVLIVGPDNRQFTELETRAKDLPVELLYLERDKKREHIPIHCDHVITTFVNKLLNDKLRENVPAGRYHLLQQTGIDAFVNKLRDIGSLLPPRA